MRTAWAWILACALVAGCSAKSEPVPSGSVAASATTTVAALDDDPGAAPTWRVGDWWTYDVQYPASSDTITATYVVHKEDNGNYHLAATTRKAGELAEFSHFPTLGPWTKTTFEPKIHDVKIPFLKFPLVDGKTWSDPYRGVPATWKATKSGPAFVVEAATQDGQAITYTYERAVGWFTDLQYSFGVPNTIMTLTARGHDFAGTVSVLTFTEHVHGGYPVQAVPPATQPPGGPPQNPATDFSVSGGKILLWGFYYGGAPGTYEFSLHPQQGFESQGVEHHPQTTDATARFLWGEIEKPNAGSWGLLCGGISQGFGFTFAEALEVEEQIVTPKRA